VRGLAVLGRLGARAPSILGTLLAPARFRHWARVEGVPLRSPPEDARQRPSLACWLSKVLAELRPHLLLVDVFPRGLLGELGAALAPGAPTAWLVARRVQPDYYLQPQVRRMIEERYARLLWCEGADARLRVLNVRQQDVAPVLIRSPSQLLSRGAARSRLGVAPRAPLVLAVGTGPVDRQADLLRLLLKVRARLWPQTPFELRVLSTELAARMEDGWQVLSVFPALPLLPAADLLVLAAGYHAVHEAHIAGVPAVFVPQPRRYDDQFGRAAPLPKLSAPEDVEAAVRAALCARAAPLAAPPAGDGAAQVADAILSEARKEGHALPG